METTDIQPLTVDGCGWRAHLQYYCSSALYWQWGPPALYQTWLLPTQSALQRPHTHWPYPKTPPPYLGLTGQAVCPWQQCVCWDAWGHWICWAGSHKHSSYLSVCSVEITYTYMFIACWNWKLRALLTVYIACWIEYICFWMEPTIPVSKSYRVTHIQVHTVDCWRALWACELWLLHYIAWAEHGAQSWWISFMASVIQQLRDLYTEAALLYSMNT